MYRIMNARNFRSQFPTLTEPVMVISREKVIGTWTPRGQEGEPEHVAGVDALINAIKERTASGPEPVRTPKERQAARDAILRKLNKH